MRCVEWCLLSRCLHCCCCFRHLSDLQQENSLFVLVVFFFDNDRETCRTFLNSNLFQPLIVFIDLLLEQFDDLALSWVFSLILRLLSLFFSVDLPGENSSPSSSGTALF